MEAAPSLSAWWAEARNGKSNDCDDLPRGGGAD
jgi:hypothetical protein